MPRGRNQSKNNNPGKSRGMSETGGGNASLSAHSGGMGTSNS
jgi:hypothetical protein